MAFSCVRSAAGLDGRPTNISSSYFQCTKFPRHFGGRYIFCPTTRLLGTYLRCDVCSFTRYSFTLGCPSEHTLEVPSTTQELLSLKFFVFESESSERTWFIHNSDERGTDPKSRQSCEESLGGDRSALFPCVPHPKMCSCGLFSVARFESLATRKSRIARPLHNRTSLLWLTFLSPLVLLQTNAGLPVRDLPVLHSVPLLHTHGHVRVHSCLGDEHPRRRAGELGAYHGRQVPHGKRLRDEEENGKLFSKTSVGFCEGLNCNVIRCNKRSWHADLLTPPSLAAAFPLLRAGAPHALPCQLWTILHFLRPVLGHPQAPTRHAKLPRAIGRRFKEGFLIR